MIQQKILKFILFFFISNSFIKAISKIVMKLDEEGSSSQNLQTSNGLYTLQVKNVENYPFLKIRIERKEAEDVIYSIYYSPNETSEEKKLLKKSSNRIIITWLEKDLIHDGLLLIIENDPKDADYRIILQGKNEKDNEGENEEEKEGGENERENGGENEGGKETGGNGGEKETGGNGHSKSSGSKTLKIVLIIVGVIIVVIIIIAIIYYIKIYKPNKDLNKEVNTISFQDDKKAMNEEIISS